MAKEQNFDMFIGEHKVINVTIYQADGITAQNITGWTFEFIIKELEKYFPAKITKTTADGIAIAIAANGTLTITMQAEDTTGFEGGKYRHSLRRTNGDAETTLLYGEINLQLATTP